MLGETSTLPVYQMAALQVA